MSARVQPFARAPLRHSNRYIFLFWLPLAATWLMMAMEGPFLAAVIARMADPKFNLAAHGVAFALAILIEAPVIMLMSAATALVEDGHSYRKLRTFAIGLCVLGTGLLTLVLIPPVYRVLTTTVIGLPPEVSELIYGALWFFLPWPGAIGYRRFLQGVLIRSGRTRLVAYGTVIRVIVMVATAITLFVTFSLPGAWLAAAALGAGVTAEALAGRWMAAPTIRELLGPAGASPPDREPLSYGRIAQFYYPLALTSLIGLAAHPMLTFFMGRALAPIESLAVFPVVHALSFMFRALGLSFQEAAIALLGTDHEHVDELGRFGLWLGLASSVGLGLVAFTPLAGIWFESISGLTPELAAFALIPTMILVPIPGLSVLLSFQRAVLVQGRKTHPITVATSIEVAGIALLFTVFGWGVGLVGATAAFLAFLGGRLAGNVYLIRQCTRVLGNRETSG